MVKIMLNYFFQMFSINLILLQYETDICFEKILKN